MKKVKFSKAIVLGIVVMNIIFTAVVLHIFVTTGQEPVAVVGAWFGFTTGELWIVGKITREKEGVNSDRAKKHVDKTKE